MPVYSYRDGDGHEYEHFAAMADPKPWKVRIDDGVIIYLSEDGEEMGTDSYSGGLPDGTYARDFGASRINGMEHVTYPYASVRLAGIIDRADAEHKDCVVRGVPRRDVPIVQSAAHERALMSKYGLARE